MELAILYLALALATLLAVRLLLLTIDALQRFAHSQRIIALETEIFSARLAATKKTQKRRTALENTWTGYRKFAVKEVAEECENVRSFYLRPHDGKSIPSFKSGQFLTFQIPQANSDKRVNRCYSLSNGPGGDTYRVTIKRVPDGLASNWFHDKVKPGAILDVKAPAGGFFLNQGSTKPVVLIAGGVGITPMMSMLMDIAEYAPNREVWFFFGVRNRADHIMAKSLEGVAKSLSNFHRHICYSRPSDTCKAGKNYDHKGRVTLERIQKEIKTTNFEFYLCGPSQMMEDLVEGLRKWGVPEKDLHREAFGPASVAGKTKKSTVAKDDNTKVIFARTGKEYDWKPANSEASVLTFACDNHIKTIDASGCHAGNCGTCQTAIKEGNFEYVREPGCQVEDGSFLPCIAVPNGHLKIDA